MMPSTPIDDLMTFNRHWVWFYYLYFLVIGFPFLLLKNRRDIVRAIAAYSVTAAITLTFYALLRTQIIRPEVVGNDLSAKLVRAMYRWDNPYNCFPSQHVANSFTAAFILLEHKRIWGIVGFVAALLISISTILIKQHWFLDFPGGLTVAIIAYIVVYRWWLRQANEK
ncbi:phosphatase PAP2 family protein [bacterium]|nr:phosphatase PAP2 family protein [bacterium]